MSRSTRLLPGLAPWLALVLLGGLPACSDTAGDDDDSAPAGDGTFEVVAEVSEAIATVITVEWSVDLDDVDDAWIEFGPEGSATSIAPADLSGGPPYETVLLGNKPATDVVFRVFASAGGETVSSDEYAATTGSPPTDLPGMSAETFGAVDDGFVVTSLFAVAPGAVILDRDGDYVWWHLADRDDFQVSRAQLSADRQHVLLWSVNFTPEPGAEPAAQELIRVSLDGTQVDDRSIPEGHHDFTVMPDGGVTVIEYDERDGIDGDRLVEIGPDGSEREIWSVWDDFTLGGGPGGSSHFNAIDYYADEDAFYVSSLGMDCLFKVDRASGDLLWTLGGDDSDFTLSGGSSDLFDKNHQFQRLDDSIVVFVNGDEDPMCSEVREYAYEDDGSDAELVWSYSPSPCVYSFTLGDVSRLDSGNTLVTFSNQGQVEEVDADGEVLWRLNASLGGAVGYATFVADLHTTD